MRIKKRFNEGVDHRVIRLRELLEELKAQSKERPALAALLGAACSEAQRESDEFWEHQGND